MNTLGVTRREYAGGAPPSRYEDQVAWTLPRLIGCLTWLACTTACGRSELARVDATCAANQPALGDAWERPLGRLRAPIGYGPTSVATDSMGRIVVSAVIAGDTTLGCLALPAIGPSDVLLASYEPSGELAWAKRFGASATTQQGAFVATDSNGRIVLVTQSDEGVGPLDASESRELTIRVLDSRGETTRERRFPVENGTVTVTAIAVSPNDDLTLAGFIAGAIDLGGGLLDAPYFDGKGGGPLLATWDAQGDLLWSSLEQTGGGAISLAIDRAGKLAVGLGFGDNYALPAIEKRDERGVLEWSRELSAASLAFDDAGNLFVGGGDRFFSKLQSSDGDTLWALPFDNATPTGCVSPIAKPLAFNRNGNLLLGINLGCGWVSLAGHIELSAGSDDGLLAVISTDGSLLANEHVGRAFALAPTKDDRVALVTWRHSTALDCVEPCFDAFLKVVATPR